MSKLRVTFKMQRIAEDNWQILADYPGAETRYIKGLKSKAEVDEWLNGCAYRKSNPDVLMVQSSQTAPWQELSDVSAALVGCGHVSGLLMRQVWPLALMLCADRVPIVRMHLEVR